MTVEPELPRSDSEERAAACSAGVAQGAIGHASNTAC
jgi:hypothetical protein